MTRKLSLEETAHGVQFTTEKSKFTLDAGRLIVKDGRPLATLHGVGNYDPTEIDLLAHAIVNCLNR